MRFRQRSSVLLPQPEGPMIAVTVCAGNRSDTSRTARCCPNSAVRCVVSSRSRVLADATMALPRDPAGRQRNSEHQTHQDERRGKRDRKSTRLNSSHGYISYAVFCLKKKTKQDINSSVPSSKADI